MCGADEVSNEVKFTDINLNVLDTYKTEFNLPFGYSDHSLGTLVSVAALAKEACIIEKHITLDRIMSGPDHRTSIETNDSLEFVNAIRDVETILGSIKKAPTNAEQQNMLITHKSLVADSNIAIGEVIIQKSLAIKRPVSGMSPYLYWSMLKQTTHRNYSEGDIIDE